MNFLLLFLTNLVMVTNGQNYYNLFSAFGVSPHMRKLLKGTEAVRGPDIPNKKTKGLDFGKDVVDITNTDTTFAEIAGRLQKYDEITFSVYFKILAMAKSELVYYPFFSMASKDGSQNYFAIDMELKEECSMVEGRKTDCKNKGMVNIRYVKLRNQRKTSLPRSGKGSITFKLGTWTSLMVRIKKTKVDVYIDCQLVASGEMDGTLGENAFPYEGVMRLSQISLPNGVQQFVGSLFQPQLMFGPRAYEWYGPCTKDNSVSPVKPEPRAWQYDGRKFNKFQAMNSEQQVQVKIWCYDEDGNPRRNNGNPWYKDDDLKTQCYRYECRNGIISKTNQCTQCRDKYNRRIKYNAKQTWIDKYDKCKRWTCKPVALYDTEKVVEKIVCPKLNCLKSDSYTPEGACCPKCHQDDCTQKRIWRDGCEKSCDVNFKGDGIVAATSECVTTKRACWCDKGHALNLDGTECVRTSRCSCRVYSGDDADGNPTYKRYKPGQSIRKSLCELCLCQHGVLSCSKQC